MIVRSSHRRSKTLASRRRHSRTSTRSSREITAELPSRPPRSSSLKAHPIISNTGFSTPKTWPRCTRLTITYSSATNSSRITKSGTTRYLIPLAGLAAAAVREAYVVGKRKLRDASVGWERLEATRQRLLPQVDLDKLAALTVSTSRLRSILDLSPTLLATLSLRK